MHWLPCLPSDVTRWVFTVPPSWQTNTEARICQLCNRPPNLCAQPHPGVSAASGRQGNPLPSSSADLASWTVIGLPSLFNSSFASFCSNPPSLNAAFLHQSSTPTPTNTRDRVAGPQSLRAARTKDLKRSPPIGSCLAAFASQDTQYQHVGATYKHTDLRGRNEGQRHVRRERRGKDVPTGQ